MSGRIEAVYRAFPVQRFPLPTAGQVADLEARLRIQLPAHYRDFVLRYNGGYFPEPYPLIVPPQRECRLHGLRTLWGIGATYPFAELGSDIDLFDDNDPPTILPIGNTTGGHLLYLITEDCEERGNVCLKLAFEWTVFGLAATMDDFFALLARDRPAP